uniref:Uncharacterized protein n=1 Tax=Amphimedon queenslandica TaxID=400682 RepID=A0A1X7SXX8_AMPQE
MRHNYFRMAKWLLCHSFVQRYKLFWQASLTMGMANSCCSFIFMDSGMQRKQK